MSGLQHNVLRGKMVFQYIFLCFYKLDLWLNADIKRLEHCPTKTETHQCSTKSVNLLCFIHWNEPSNDFELPYILLVCLNFLIWQCNLSFNNVSTLGNFRDKTRYPEEQTKIWKLENTSSLKHNLDVLNCFSIYI